MQAIWDTADVKGRAAQKAAARRDQLKETSAARLQTKLAEMARSELQQPARGGPPRGPLPAAARGSEAGL